MNIHLKKCVAAIFVSAMAAASCSRDKNHHLHYREKLKMDLGAVTLRLRVEQTNYEQSKDPKEKTHLAHKVRALAKEEALVKTKLANLDRLLKEKYGVEPEDNSKEEQQQAIRVYERQLEKYRNSQAKQAREDVEMSFMNEDEPQSKGGRKPAEQKKASAHGGGEGHGGGHGEESGGHH